MIPKWLFGLGIVIFLIYWRSPNLFFEPRFWAEEGEGYFAFAFSHSIMESLIAPRYGYFNLVANISCILATFAPIELAPLVMTLLAAVVQILVSSYFIFSDSPYWDTYPKKIALACFIQLLCPIECWLTTLASQYFLSIMAFLILLDTDLAQESWIKWPSRTLLSVSSLTSPAVTFLLPVFIFKSFKTRLREDWVRVAIVSFGAFIQVIALIQTCLNASSQIGNRFDSSGFNLPSIIFLHLTESMVGGPYYSWCFKYLGDNAGIVALVLFVTMVFILFDLYLIYLVIKSFFCKQLQLLGIAFIFLTVPVILVSLGLHSSFRAAFAPSIILIVMMVYECGNAHSKLFSRQIALFSLSGLMILGLLLHNMKIYRSDSLPVWKDEVNLWRQDSKHLLRIWPVPWLMKLEARSHASREGQNQ